MNSSIKSELKKTKLHNNLPKNPQDNALTEKYANQETSDEDHTGDRKEILQTKKNGQFLASGDTF